MFENKNVLIAGGCGLIGHQLANILVNDGANVLVADLQNKEVPGTKHAQTDLTVFENCKNVCNDMDYVFNLLCVKGSPKSMKERPVYHFDTTVLFNTNLLRAAHTSRVKKFLYASSLGVYPPAQVFYEDDAWKGNPSEHDKFAGWAKRMGELQAEAYSIQHEWKDIKIVRPGNTYGPFDDFKSEKAMVIPSLIRKIVENPEEVSVWGDGKNVRDFIHSEDVARGMIAVMQSNLGPTQPVNLGSGKGYTIEELLNIIVKHVGKNTRIKFDTSKTSGDRIRILDVSRAKEIGFEPKVDFKTGIENLIDWYIASEHNAK